MKHRVRIDIDQHVATVTLDRPEKRNAVDFDMFAAIADAADKVSADSKIRAVVLAGRGNDFCAGIDISVFAGQGIGTSLGELMQPRTASGANYFQQAALCWRDLAVPVIAALQGSVFGAGLQVALGADMRLAAPGTHLSVMEIRWGLIPDMAITATLPGILAGDRARELCYTGRVVDAGEALDLGLVTRICDDPLADAQALAADIASRSPDAVRAIKRLINETWSAGRSEPARSGRGQPGEAPAGIPRSRKLNAAT